MHRLSRAAQEPNRFYLSRMYSRVAGICTRMYADQMH